MKSKILALFAFTLPLLVNANPESPLQHKPETTNAEAWEYTILKFNLTVTDNVALTKNIEALNEHGKKGWFLFHIEHTVDPGYPSERYRGGHKPSNAVAYYYLRRLLQNKTTDESTRMNVDGESK